MQYYTKQQLQGAGAYGPRCRIGNWDEDLMAEETQFKDFLKAKDRGELKVRGRRGRGGTRGLRRAPGRGRPRSARQGPARGGPPGSALAQRAHALSFVSARAPPPAPGQIDKFNRRVSAALQGVELVQSESDEYVHFGDVLQVRKGKRTRAAGREGASVGAGAAPADARARPRNRGPD